MKRFFLTMSLILLVFSCTKEESENTAITVMANKTQNGEADTEKITTVLGESINDSEMVVLQLPKEGVQFPIGYKDMGVERDAEAREMPIFDESGENIITVGFLDYSYSIGKYEVTYRLWKKVYDWTTIGSGKNKGYVFSKGEQGYAGIPDKIRKSDDVFDCGYQTPDETHPVTGVNWYDCIVWCNAYSEMTGAVPVYYKKEIADESGKIKEENIKNYGSFLGMHEIPPQLKSALTTAVGSLLANALDIYDMSGNVSEWCFDYYPKTRLTPSGRTLQGASCGTELALIAIGDKGLSQPNIIAGKNKVFPLIPGLRLCRTK